jgi:hypothetical protein
MSETSSSRPSLWFAVLAVAVAAAVWATVAMAAGSAGSKASSSPPAAFGGQPMYAASGGTHSQGDCPNMGSGSGSGGSTTPSTPSTQNGSSNPGL